MRSGILKRGAEPWVPTIRALRWWWGRFNRELFDGELYPPQLSYGNEATPGYGSAECDGVMFPLGSQRVRIHVADNNTIRQAVLSTLAHEMVHQWQYQNGLPTNHGLEFDAWMGKIYAETGLRCI